MKRLEVCQLIDLLSAKVENVHLLTPYVDGFSIDCRDVLSGDAFFVLKGANFNHLQFIFQAQQNGANLAVVEHAFAEIDLPQLVVDNSFDALTLAVKWWGDCQQINVGSSIEYLRTRRRA
jgi:UDP-N-acetylmuramyl pentapeptide synthase